MINSYDDDLDPLEGDFYDKFGCLSVVKAIAFILFAIWAVLMLIKIFL